MLQKPVLNPKAPRQAWLPGVPKSPEDVTDWHGFGLGSEPHIVLVYDAGHMHFDLVSELRGLLKPRALEELR